MNCALMHTFGCTIYLRRGYHSARSQIRQFLRPQEADEQKCRYMADVFSDKDGYDGMVFTRWYADMVAKGEPIIWEDLM